MVVGVYFTEEARTSPERTKVPSRSNTSRSTFCMQPHPFFHFAPPRLLSVNHDIRGRLQPLHHPFESTQSFLAFEIGVDPLLRIRIQLHDLRSLMIEDLNDVKTKIRF